VKVLKAIEPLSTKNLIRGQFDGYSKEPGVASCSVMETFAALRLEVDSWRWKGVPFFIRAGKNLPVTCTEVIGRFRSPPISLKGQVLPQNYLRFRISPEMTIAMGATVLASGQGLKGQTVEMVARQDYVEEAWRIVDPILKAESPIYAYERGTWGPTQVGEAVTPPGGWVNPTAKDEEDYRVAAQTV